MATELRIELRVTASDGSTRIHPELLDDERTPRELIWDGSYDDTLAVYRTLENAGDRSVAERRLNEESYRLFGTRSN